MKRILLITLLCVLTMMSAITAGATNVITLKTSKAVGETISLLIYRSGTGNITLTGADGTWNGSSYVSYKLTSQTVTITGDVTQFSCRYNSITSLDVSGDHQLFPQVSLTN